MQRCLTYKIPNSKKKRKKKVLQALAYVYNTVEYQAQRINSFII